MHLEIEYKHKLSEEDKVTALVVAVAAGPKYANTIFNKTRMIESRDKEVTCEELITVCHGIWRLSNVAKTSELKEKELSLANPGSFANEKKCFLCGSTEHMKYQCPKFKADEGVKCTYPEYTVYRHGREAC